MTGAARTGRLAAAVLLALSAPAQAGSFGMRLDDGRTVSVTVPEACRMSADRAGSGMSCGYKAPDGDFRNIILSAETTPLRRFLRAFSIDAAEFRTAPEAYMRATLRAMERMATGGPPGPGQRLLRADAEIVPAAPGTDVCLRFDFDYSGPLGPLGEVRSDNGGVRCLSYDAGSGEVTYVFLEYMNLHGDMARRDPAHDREMRRIAASLRVLD
jgi:hypothetical protein